MKPVIIIAIAVVCSIGLGFSINVSADENLIPSWVKNTALWYGQDQVSDIEFINALQFMITNDIIQIPEQSKSIDDVGDFYITYESNLNSYYEYSAKEWITDLEYFETQIDYLNENFKLPHDVEILLTECNVPTAFYDLELKQITVCYELMDSTYNDFSIYFQTDLQNSNITEDEISTQSLNVIDFIFYHELGHALIDIYDLPVTGLEENAVDQFATMFMLLSDDIEGIDIIVGQDILYDVGTWFIIQTEYYEQTDYWDVHNLDIQRFYNISCYAYGQDPNYNQYLIDEGWLPTERSENCYFEYELMANSWNSILSKYYK